MTDQNLNMSMDTFSPKIAELQAMVAKSKGLVIKDSKDKEGRKKVHEAQMELREARVAIEKTFKQMRENANSWIKAVIQKENEVVAIIKPTEDALKAEKERVDKEEAQEMARIAAEAELRLQIRIDELISYGNQYNLSEIKAMSDEDFRSHADSLKTKWEADEVLRKEKEEKDRLIQEQADKDRQELEALRKKNQELEDQKKKAEDDRLRKQELEQARIDAAAKATKETEDRIKADQIRKANEEKVRKEQEEADRKIELQKADNKKRYISFLKEHGYTNETKEDFKIERTETGVILYKILGEFTI